jgi:tetratricopeptide (TPR) repeat protein
MSSTGLNLRAALGLGAGPNFRAKLRRRARVHLYAALIALFCALGLARAPVAAAANDAPGVNDSSTASVDEIARRAIASAVEASSDPAYGEGSASAYEVLARDLLLRIELIETELGAIARELQTPLFELGKLYVQEDQCQNAIPIIQRAIRLSQRMDGVMNAKQLPLYEPMLECYVALDLITDLERAQDQMLLVNESTYGKDDIRILPSLAHAAQWYEQAGLYENARQLHSRAIRIAQKVGGKQDIRTVIPLRGMARTYRLEAQYAESVRSGALDAAGERTLERAATIARTHAGADPTLRIETLLELGDWYQMAGAIRDAAKVYKEVWLIASGDNVDSKSAVRKRYAAAHDNIDVTNAEPEAERIVVTATKDVAVELLGHPEPILYRARVGVALRRPPPDREKLQHYWVDFQFTVTRHGEVKDVVVTDATAPKDLQLSLAENLKTTHYRPRFVDGEPVDTTGNRIRQGVWVGK